MARGSAAATTGGNRGNRRDHGGHRVTTGDNGGKRGWRAGGSVQSRFVVPGSGARLSGPALVSGFPARLWCPALVSGPA
ncbi:hypothetical protein GCM10027075_60650 [Streptomyces heilongjiangensis]